MKTPKLTLGALLTGIIAGPAMAQDIFMCGQTDMILTRTNDKNNNNTANEAGEYSKVADGFAANLLREGIDIKATTMFGAPGLLWLDNRNSSTQPAHKALTKLVDVNGDGMFQDSEISTIMGTLNGPGKFGASSAGNTFLAGICEDSAGNVYVANNQFNLTTPVSNGILKISNILTTPTAALAITTADIVLVYEDTATPNGGGTNTTGGSFERIAMRKATNTIYSYHTKDDVIYSLRDIDSDGKFITAGEIVNFVNLSGHKAGLARNIDFDAGGVYAARGSDFANVTPSATNGNYLALLYNEVNESNGVVWLGTRTQTQNLGSTDISGMILRCEDLNSNGTCNDAGEVKIFVDPFGLPFGTFQYNGVPYPPSMSNTPGWCGLGVDTVTGNVYAACNDGPQDISGTFKADILWKFVDNNNDDDANDVGEQIALCVQRPAGSFLNEIEVCNIGFNTNFPTASNFEVPGAQNPLNITALCNSGSGNPNVVPGIRFYRNAPYLGNPDFQISVTGIQIGIDYAQLFISEADWDPIFVGALWAALCPGDPLFCVNPGNRNLDEWLPLGIWNTSSPMYNDLLDLYATGTFWVDAVTLSTADAIMGSCTGPSGSTKYIGRYDFSFLVPNNPILAGKSFRAQWHVGDPLSLPLVGSGFAFPRAVSDLGIIVVN
ncbi:MAG: hypothetical protein ACKVS6_11555 [Planctomycetota bacterium]